MEGTKMIAKYETCDKREIFSMVDAVQTFGIDFLDETACRMWILKSLHGESAITCPECGSGLTDKGLQRFWSGCRVRCCSCGKFFTSLTGTVLSGVHLEFRAIMLLAVLLFFGVKADYIAGKLDVSIETIRIWKKKFTVTA
jgi:transposase-like protein